MLRALPVSLALLVAATADAAPKRLAVVDVDSPPNMIGLASQVTTAILRHARDQGYSVHPPDALRKLLGDKPYANLQACRGSVTCVGARLGGVKADRVVAGSLTRDEKNYVLRLWLVDLGTMAVVAEVNRTILIASRRLNQDVNEAVPRLLRGEREATGTLVVTTTVRNVRVFVDGAPAGPAPVTLELKPGKHEVRLEKQGYLPVQRLVTVEAKATTREEVRLILKPGEVDPDEELPPLATGSAVAASSGGAPTGALVAGGVALLAAGAGTYFGLTASSQERRLQEGFDPARAVYAGTRAEALAGRQNALYANVAFGIAGAAAATGVVLLLLSGGDEPGEKVELSPTASPSAAGVILRGRF